MTQLHELTALEQAAAIRNREVSAGELAEAYLRRIEERDGALNAYLTVTADLATRQARQADAVIRAGDSVPPLHGVPIAVKDVTRVAGTRCTFGSAEYSSHVPDTDDHVVRKLRAAGTVLLGKTNTPEFALTCYTENKLGPPTRNPWDTRRTPGGSSGGAGAAVAAGLAPIAHGTDHGGSIRIPASACGLVGIKPSRGRISNGPFGDFSGMSTHGPLARTVADAAALLDAMAGPMPGDTRLAPPLPDGETFLRHARREPGRLRIAATTTPLLPGVTVHPECVAAYQQAAKQLESLGHVVTDVVLPDEPLLAEAFIEVMVNIAALPDVGDESRLMPFTRTLRSMAANVSGQQLARALSFFDAGTRRLAEVWAGYDVLLSPTLAQPPGPIGTLRNDDDQDAEFTAQAAFMPFTPLHNITGQPSISLPLYHTIDGLPVGVMLAGLYGAEHVLISLAGQLEAAASWTNRRPPVW